MEGTIYIATTEKALFKAKKQMKEEAIKSYGEDEVEDNLIFAQDGILLKEEEVDVEEGTIAVSGNSELGFIRLDITLDTDITLKLIELATKKLNKFKTLLEAVK